MKTKRNGWLILLFCMMPLIIMGVLSWWKGFDLSKFTLVYSDEVSWYGQVAAVVKYGRPLGYYGYNGTHAQIGTFGPWGVSVVYLVALFPKLLSFFFEMNESVMILGNLGWACFANGLFILLAKPNREQLKALILLYLCLFVNHLYMFIAMAEIVRFSVAIILSGIFCFLHNQQNHLMYRIMLYIVAPVAILAAASMYVVFGVLFPVWFYFIYKNNEKLLRRRVLYFIATFFLSVFITLFMYIINNGYFACPYMDANINLIMEAFKKGVKDGLVFTAQSILTRIGLCHPGNIILSIDLDYGFFSAQLLLYYFMIVLSVCMIVKGRKNSLKNTDNHFIIAFLLMAWLVVFIVLYYTGGLTLLRGLNVVLAFAFYYLAMTDMNAARKVLLIAVFSFIPFLLLFSDMFLYKKNDTGRMDLSEKFSDLIVLNEKSEDPWENTVAYYGFYEKHGVDLPIGAGVNLMQHNGINEKAKYAIIEDDGYTDTEKSLQNLLDHDHKIIFQEGNIVVLKNMDYD